MAFKFVLSSYFKNLRICDWNWRGDIIRVVESDHCYGSNHLFNIVSTLILFVASAYGLFVGCFFCKVITYNFTLPSCIDVNK